MFHALRNQKYESSCVSPWVREICHKKDITQALLRIGRVYIFGEVYLIPIEGEIMFFL